MRLIFNFIKQEAVMIIALLLGLISMFIVKPDNEYLNYIDFRTLGILFSLMAVMAGFQSLGVFEKLAIKLLNKVGSIRELIITLTLLCFFFSMIITNDVALITFVPFTFVLLKMTGKEIERKWLIPVVVLQTIAANLGSMLTPLGNPQNLYLYSLSGISFTNFVKLMLPYALASLAMLFLWIYAISHGNSKKISITLSRKNNITDNHKVLMYIFLLGICILAVFRLITIGIAFTLTVILVWLFDRNILKKVDYKLLLTFVGFFIFVGNVGRIPVFHSVLSNILSGNETLTAIIASQGISNVPAALLLSNFTTDTSSLIIGTNLGGLGTLIASMASLISYKFLSQRNDVSNLKYILYFTFANLLFLAVLIAINYLL